MEGGRPAAEVPHRRDLQRSAPEPNLFHALARTERYPDTLWEVVDELRAMYAGPEWTELRASLAQWLAERAKAADIEGFEKIKDWEAIMEKNGHSVLREAWKFRLAEIRDEGKAEGKTDLVGRLAARRFGPETAERLVAAVGPRTGKRLEEVADAIYASDTEADLLARVERMA